MIKSNNESNRINDRFVNRAAFILYLILNITLTVFHEPWYDEAESWLIARDASWYDIILIRPHFEGHPPLWHLILAMPAKLGLPYEASIKTIQFIFAFAMVYLIIFCSPFHKYIRRFLPFTFFFLYQYGVIARPYALFCSAMFMTAMFWNRRDERPWRVIISMMILCMSSAYGIVIAGGMTSVWVFESLQNERSSFYRNHRRLAAWSALFVLAIMLIVEILPADETYAVIFRNIAIRHGFLWMFLFFWLVVPSETVITSCSTYACIFEQDLDILSFAATSLVSVLIWLVLIGICKRRKQTLLLLVPYFLLSIIAASRYFIVHHYGLILAFYISVMWICADCRPISITSVDEWMGRSFPQASVSVRRLLAAGSKLLIVLLIGINVFWSVVSFYNEIRFNYSSSRTLARFILDNDLQGYRWLGAWRILRDADDPQKILLEDAGEANLESVEVNPYLGGNLVYNSPSHVSYVTHIVTSPGETRSIIDGLKEEPEPDFILSPTSDFPQIEKQLDLSADYTQFAYSYSSRIWKGDPFPRYPDYVYIRHGLSERLGLYGVD